jgi:ankyrin repeat protein
MMLEIPIADRRAVALVAAIQKGEAGKLQELLREAPDLAAARIVDDRGVKRTLLHVVADWPGHFANGARTVAALIAAGADVNAPVTPPDQPGVAETPLHWAASSDDVLVLDALLDGGADLEAPGAVFTGGTAMSDAVVFAQWNAARRLLERGAKTTLWQAAALGLLDRVQTYFASDSPPSSHDVTNALWHACRAGHRNVAEYLVAHGADLHWVGHQGKTPLEVARESRAEDLIQWLDAGGGAK